MFGDPFPASTGCRRSIPATPPPTQVPIDPPTVLDPLIDLLERLPIPLMLQTTTGRVVTQNLAWRQQVEELRDPGQVRREAALILESIAWKERQGEAIGASPSPPIDRVSDGLPIDVWTNPIRPDDGVVRQSGSCRLGIEPNTCVCICPMKNGQDRVWKFLKIPMGIAPSHFDRRFDLAFSQASIETLDPSPASQFKLATLGFSPDPVWRLLAQTESLWLVLAQDTTEQHQVARELAAKNADLVQLNRLKDEFLACISHELKTPLTAVLGLSSLLKDHLLGELNERQSRYAQLIYQSGRHLILIVNDILDLTRIETGQLDLTLEPVQVEAVCLHAHEQARQMHLLESAEGRSAMAEGRSDIFAQFSLDIQPGVENLVADELRLRQMLSNLLSNALKFTPATGEIGLRVESWDGWIAFTVWDTGIGIPADKQHLIFQKFQQLENPLTRQFEGTGLGLVLTQRLARLHGGDVTFTSVEGAGSQFTLLLPPSPPQAPSQAPQNLKVEHRSSFGQPTTITARNRLVIVVEATPQLIEELSRQLAGLGYRVAIARSGTEALEKFVVSSPWPFSQSTLADVIRMGCFDAAQSGSGNSSCSTHCDGDAS
ncbi:MAG: hypothetical protein HC769_13510 [Cyanobacteria bacterium CRU_2_1]|nr:hypothetical protein [Cyanobacteria bacterium CRU_2_1]